MDEETRKILTGLAPFSINSKFDFVPASYLTKKRDAEGKELNEYLIPECFHPTITIRPWSRKETIESVKALTKFQTDMDDTLIRDLVRKSVQGWVNLLDASTAEEVAFEPESATDTGAKKSLFESFPLTLILDISHKIGNISGLNKHEKLGLK